MATVAIRLSAKQCVATFGGIRIEIDSATWFQRRQCQLIELQGAQLACNPVAVGIGCYVAELCLGRNRELRRIVETLIEECAFSMHFINCHKRIPICDRSPSAGPGVQIVPRQSAGIWY